MAAAAQAGIIQGRTPTLFGPWENVTRAQMVTMVVRAGQNLYSGKLANSAAGYSGTLGNFDSTHAENMRKAEYNGLLVGLVGFGPGWELRGRCG